MTLLERARELVELDGVIEAAGAGDGRLVVVEGPAGIGKTALVELVGERARAGGQRVLVARAGQLESSCSYGVVLQWLEREWRRSSGAGAAEDAAALVLSRGRGPALAGEDASFGILHGLYWFVADLALERPLMLLLDDAQWADLDSLRFVSYLQRRLGGLALGVVVAARVGEGGAAAELLGGLVRGPSARLVAPAPLGEAGAAALLERAFGRAVGVEFSRACHRATGGNPHYLIELQRALALDGVAPVDGEAGRAERATPAALERYLLERLAAVSADALPLAGAMGVLGDGASVRHAARLAVLEPSRAAEVARLLVRAGILASEDPVAFAHPIVQRVILRHLTSVEREQGHLAAARLLLEEEASPERVAAHLLLTSPGAREWCVRALRAAANEAMRRSAAEAAAGYLRRADAEPPEASQRLAVLRELGAAEALIHDPRAIEHLEQALGAVREPRARAEIALQLAAALLDLFRSVDACRVLEAALAELDPAERELRGRLQAALVSNAYLDAATVEAGVRALAACASDPPPGPGGRAIRVQNGMAVAHGGGSAAQARALLEAGLADAGEQDLAGTFENGVMTLIMAEGFERAAEFLERFATLPAARLVRRRAASLGTMRGFRASRLGALGEAELHLRGSLELTPEATHPGGWLVVRALLADVLTLQGSLDDANRTLSDGPPEPWPMHVGTGFALAARARLRFAQGRTQEGLDDLAVLAGGEAAMGPVGPALHHWRADAATALVALDRRPEARTVLASDLELARSYGAPRALGVTLRAAGVVEGGQHGLGLLSEAVDVLARSPALLERARALVELGAALRRANQRRLAREHLDEGLRLAQRCGARPLAQRAYEELLASGKHLRRMDLEDRDALTPGELRIARLAAEGMTNREIARSLYLSVKTVEMHLGRAYRKLDITTRAQLPTALVRRSGTTPARAHDPPPAARQR